MEFIRVCNNGTFGEEFRFYIMKRTWFTEQSWEVNIKQPSVVMSSELNTVHFQSAYFGFKGLKEALDLKEKTLAPKDKNGKVNLMQMMGMDNIDISCYKTVKWFPQFGKYEANYLVKDINGHTMEALEADFAEYMI